MMTKEYLEEKLKYINYQLELYPDDEYLLETREWVIDELVKRMEEKEGETTK